MSGSLGRFNRTEFSVTGAAKITSPCYYAATILPGQLLTPVLFYPTSASRPITYTKNCCFKEL